MMEAGVVVDDEVGEATEVVAEETMVVEGAAEVVVTEMGTETVTVEVEVMIVVTEDVAEEMTMTDIKQGKHYSLFIS